MFVYFQPYLKKRSNLTVAYFSDGLVKNHQVGIEYIFGVAPSQDGKSDYDDGYWNPGVLGATNQNSTSFIFSEIG